MKGNKSYFKWFSEILRGNARFRQSFWKWWYNFLSNKYKNVEEWTCMNYGYVNAETLNPAFEETSKNLYLHAIDGVSIEGKSLLEIGCGRGGGLHHLHTTKKPSQSTGLDLSEWNIAFCQSRFQANNLSYVVGSADKLPFEDNSFDAIINVESSHIYPDFEAFLKEVKRVLKPGGYFGFADFRSNDQKAPLIQHFNENGFSNHTVSDISDNVRLALNADEENRVNLIRKYAPKWLQSPVSQFAGVPGSKFYKDLSSGETVYLSLKSHQLHA